METQIIEGRRVSEVLSSTDYDKFILLDCNRSKVSLHHVEKLAKSIKENGFLPTHAIIVNTRHEVIDGQHRFLACKKEGMPVLYRVVEDGENLMLMLNNTQKRWGIQDYINYFALREENPNYIRIREACEMAKLPPTIAIAVAEGRMSNGTDSQKIKMGELIFTEGDVEAVIQFAQNLRQVATNIRQTLNKRMSDALIDLSKKEGFSWKKMLSQSAHYSTKAYPCVSKADYIIMLRDVYNYNTRNSDNRLR